jgi:hypothetical protein
MKSPWEKPPPPKTGRAKKLTPAEQARARGYAQRAGRRYPNLIDNMRVIKERDRG